MDLSTGLGNDLRPLEQRARAILIGVPGLGPMRASRLLHQFGSATCILEADDRSLAGVPGMTDKLVADIRHAENGHATHKGRIQKRIGNRMVLSPSDENYPVGLRSIYAPPAFLWSDGFQECARRRCIAVVGTRRPSSYGKSMAYSLAYEIAASGIVVVSGLAFGIDAAAHQGAIDAGGKTIAVLGSGLDRLYPARHRELAIRVRQNGALLSEFPLAMSARPGHFPRRNRLISGLSDATIVVEAYDNGGALLTAKLALDQNRDVWAVPGQIGNPAAVGTNRLIQVGEAQLLTGVSDVLEELPTPARESLPAPVDAGSLLALLSAAPKHIDSIAGEVRLPMQDVLIQLTLLECAGRVRQLPGKYFVRGTVS